MGRAYEQKIIVADAKCLRTAAPSWSTYSSKRENGKIVIIGGSERHHGATALTYFITTEYLATFLSSPK
jgi:NAD(P)H-hydrate repair Nnr-like enzyme with NAD(P)H-hydrate dehydratase domain